MFRTEIIIYICVFETVFLGSNEKEQKRMTFQSPVMNKSMSVICSLKNCSLHIAVLLNLVVKLNDVTGRPLWRSRTNGHTVPSCSRDK